MRKGGMTVGGMVLSLAVSSRLCVLCVGSHYPNGTFICDKACYDRMCAHDAANFYAWAKEDKRVAALAPWNWGGCAACNGSRWTPPHT